MRSHRWTLPNLLSLMRLVLVPVLWALALVGLAKAVGAGLIIAAVTDVLDGRLARMRGQTSSFGSKLDSIADMCVNFSALGWLLVLRPEVVRGHPFFFTSLTAAGVFSLLLGWVKFGRLADFHLNSGRAAGIAGYLLLIDLFLFNHYVEPLFYAMMVLAWIVAIEALLLLFTRDTLDERVPSPLLAYLHDDGGRRKAEGS
jgi:CDP-diacylglycerol--glycerol-3-phosphate 3-phosphatidyltransferase